MGEMDLDSLGNLGSFVMMDSLLVSGEGSVKDDEGLSDT